ncbi:MAG: glycosyltransferase family 2 protein [Symploca sp. SIO3E6]|nr:glycosyltransferase family 2 protein [Caldora sp. SIO3E6]
MEESKYRIVIISPVRNEDQFIGGVINSMVNQTIKPVEWIIVDDGSTDKTLEIVTKAAQEHPWIHVEKKPDRGMRAVGPGVVEAFYYGYDRLHTQDYDFIGKMDADIEFGPKYFETLLTFFANDRYLGAASGKPFLEENEQLIEERTNDEMVAGQINFYRRKCFENIGGFVRQVHWDGIAYHRSRMEGWRSRSIRHPDLNFIHKRLMGSSHKGIVTGRLRWGKGQYFMGTHPLYIFAIGIYRIVEKPFLIGGLFIIIGYFQAWLESMPRYDYPDFRKSLHAWQFERLKLGKRLEIIPEPQPEQLQ